MNKKLILSLAAAVAAGTVFAAPAAVAPRRVCLHDFQGRLTVTAWPKAAKANVTIVENAEKKSKVMRAVVPADAKGTTFYGTSNCPEGPGTLRLTFDYKFAGSKDAKFSMTMLYNYRGKGNGSAGKTPAKIDYSDKWTTFEKEFKLPAKAAALQYVFGVSGSGAEVLVDNMKITFTPETPAAK